MAEPDPKVYEVCIVHGDPDFGPVTREWITLEEALKRYPLPEGLTWPSED